MLQEIESEKKSINSSSKSSQGNNLNIYKLNTQKLNDPSFALLFIVRHDKNIK